MTAPPPPSTLPPPAAASSVTPAPEDVAARGAGWVAAGIFLSRIIGFVRQRVINHYLGTSPAASVFYAAMKVPNFLQNLLGEGVLAGSFVPVYARLEGAGRKEEADRLAGAVFGLLALTVGLFVALGLWASPWLVDLLAPGFSPELKAQTTPMVRILFPATGVLVMSAWCLGILNSHRRFFLSYAAPVVWSGAIIATLLVFGRKAQGTDLVEYLAWGTAAGSVLQFAIQLPSVLRLLGRFRPGVELASPAIRQTLRSFGPVLLSRGVVQVSAAVDQIIASLVSIRVYAAVFNAQTLYMLPVSLFGMSVSVAELTEMSRESGGTLDEAAKAKLRERISGGCARIAFFVVPSAAAFLFLGDIVAAALFETGQFKPSDSRLVWILLMGSAVGLLASTQGRLYASGFYAMKDTRRPLYFAALRVTIGAVGAWLLALHAPEWLGVSPELGGVGLTVAAGMAAWVELLCLRRGMEKRVGRARLSTGRLARLWGAALVAAAAAMGLKLALGRTFGTRSGDFFLPFLPPAPALWPLLVAALVFGIYGVAYFGVTAAMGIPQATAIVGKVMRRVRRR